MRADAHAQARAAWLSSTAGAKGGAHRLPGRGYVSHPPANPCAEGRIGPVPLRRDEYVALQLARAERHWLHVRLREGFIQRLRADPHQEALAHRAAAQPILHEEPEATDDPPLDSAAPGCDSRVAQHLPDAFGRDLGNRAFHVRPVPSTRWAQWFSVEPPNAHVQARASPAIYSGHMLDRTQPAAPRSAAVSPRRPKIVERIVLALRKPLYPSFALCIVQESGDAPRIYELGVFSCALGGKPRQSPAVESICSPTVTKVPVDRSRGQMDTTANPMEEVGDFSCCIDMANLRQFFLLPPTHHGVRVQPAMFLEQSQRFPHTGLEVVDQE